MVNDSASGADSGYDVFISHASEDKDFVTPLAHALRDAGLRVWYDEFELGIGDSINEQINVGLSSCLFGIVVLSPSFFRKHWTQHEMSGLMARQMSGDRLIIPIWHRITKNEIVEHAPSMTDIVALNTSTQDLATIVRAISDKVGGSISVIEPVPPPLFASTQHIGPKFGVFYIAHAHTRELPFPGQPDGSKFLPSFPPTGWVSMVQGDDELEFVLDGSSLRIRLDYGNQWQGDEIVAHRFLTGTDPFALIIRSATAGQTYYPSVVNSAPRRQRFGDRNRSGWVNLQIRQ